MIELFHGEGIVALATPAGRSALAVVRVAGTDCIATVARICRPSGRIANALGHTLHHVTLINPTDEDEIDDVVVAIYRAPRSYNGEDTVEIFAHGNPAGLERILEALYATGLRPAAPGEFTQRAFLNGKLDLTRAEAVQEIVVAQTAAAHRLALHRLHGGISARIDAIKDSIVQIMAQIAVQLDYPEEETGPIVIDAAAVRSSREQLSALAATYRTGRLYQEGAVVAIGGRTNAGKSSLLNALVREDRAIVSAVPGTTRDYIDARVAMQGVPIALYDTAGLREAQEEIEHEGIQRSKRILESADLVLYLVDGTRGFQTEDRELLREFAAAAVLMVWTKVDDAAAAPAPPGFIPVSARTRAGLEELSAQVVARLEGGITFDSHAVVIDSVRQRDLLNRAVEALHHVEEGLSANTPLDAISLDVQEALNALGEITGEVSSADVLDAVFAQFCVGK